jgi:hypothetical protein
MASRRVGAVTLAVLAACSNLLLPANPASSNTGNSTATSPSMPSAMPPTTTAFAAPALRIRTANRPHVLHPGQHDPTIEQILGLPPMNQFDLVASPTRTAFVEEARDEDREDGREDKNFAPFNHLPNQVPLDKGVAPAATALSATSAASQTSAVSALAKAWAKAKVKIFAGKSTKPDSEDQDTVNHLNWYEATDFKRPYPGEATVRPPTQFKDRLGHPKPDLDD